MNIIDANDPTVATIFDQLDEFLESNHRNLYIGDNVGNIYLRKGYHHIDKNIELCLDIANVNVSKQFQNQGWFKSFLQYAIQKCPYKYIYIENVLTPRFSEFFQKNGWTRIPNLIENCFYLKVK
jgi:N-acetylglutamate synthase-like GNAT family acetyltransferase